MFNFYTGIDQICQYKSHNDTHITCTLPPLGHFTGHIQIVVPGIGASNKTTEESRIMSVLQMTGVSPDTGSLFGNTQINISGLNFGFDATKVYYNIIVFPFLLRFICAFIFLFYKFVL